MAVRKSLGPLNYIRIWYDNTSQGASASWFLNYIIVRDLQTMAKSHLVCQQWLAVEKDDGQIECRLPIASELQKQKFNYMLSKQVYQSVSDGHLWLSIFSRPPSNLIFNCMNMFISIINNRFCILRQNLAQTVNEGHEIFTFIFRKFKRWTGIWQPSKLELQKERDVLMRCEYHDPIERFPEKIEQLLEALNRICMDQQVGTPKQKITTVSTLPIHRCRRIQQA